MCQDLVLESNPESIDSNHVNTATPFPVMNTDGFGDGTIENWRAQPSLPYSYTTQDPRPVARTFANVLVLGGEILD